MGFDVQGTSGMNDCLLETKFKKYASWKKDNKQKQWMEW
jgi:hypothetical protein